MVTLLVLSGWGPWMAIGFGAALGGAASNFVDRVLRGFVIDYIALPGGLVVNVGDLSIALGTFAALGGFFASALD